MAARTYFHIAFLVLRLWYCCGGNSSLPALTPVSPSTTTPLPLTMDEIMSVLSQDSLSEGIPEPFRTHESRVKRQLRRQSSSQGDCSTLEGIPGTCSIPDNCRFPPAIKTRLFRSHCVSRSGQRGICCPGVPAANEAVTASNREQFNQAPQSTFDRSFQQPPQQQQNNFFASPNQDNFPQRQNQFNNFQQQQPEFQRQFPNNVQRQSFGFRDASSSPQSSTQDGFSPNFQTFPQNNQPTFQTNFQQTPTPTPRGNFFQESFSPTFQSSPSFTEFNNNNNNNNNNFQNNQNSNQFFGSPSPQPFNQNNVNQGPNQFNNGQQQFQPTSFSPLQRFPDSVPDTTFDGINTLPQQDNFGQIFDQEQNTLRTTFRSFGNFDNSSFDIDKQQFPQRSIVRFPPVRSPLPTITQRQGRPTPAQAPNQRVRFNSQTPPPSNIQRFPPNPAPPPRPNSLAQNEQASSASPQQLILQPQAVSPANIPPAQSISAPAPPPPPPAPAPVPPGERTADCPTTPVCFHSKYRTFDGSCNNLDHPNWGKGNFAFPRLLPPMYADGISAPRRATDGSSLPSARLVSSTLISDVNMPDNFNTAMIMSFGQFLDHDLTRTAINKGENNTGIACCRKEMIADPSLRHAECFPIEIPVNDRFYSQFNQTCMEFVRSLAAPRPDCRRGPREQLNQITSFIDASNIYGSTKEESDDLRTFQRGKLTTSRVNNVDLLPFTTNKPDFCSKPDQGLFCFKAGDSRVNEQISLTALHTVWLREHNRVAENLAQLNPSWTDEQIFQEARRITGAELQHITYNEFLPVLLGRRTMQASELLLQREGYSFEYDPTANPSITNEFATAAYRFGHTLIPGQFMMLDDQGQEENIPLRGQFNKPFQLFKPGGLDHCIRGLCTQRSQQFDSFITQEVTEHLFERNRRFGLDLVAINLQRGRDHGLPGYNTWRQFCGLARSNSIDSLTSEMSQQFISTLKRLYKNVDDIDLFVAGIAEKALSGAKLGPTFACIVADQFKRLKKGDRFWYERGFNSPFSQEQLQEIRKVTFARVLCDNSDGIQQIQQFVFFAPARGNTLMPCNGNFIPRMDLSKWRGEPLQ